MFAAAAATGILSLYGSPALADTDASAVAKDSPGVASGNAVQVPIDVPVNACGNTVAVLAAFDAALGNSCENTSYGYGDYGDYGVEEYTPPSPSASPTPPPTSKPTPPPTRISETHRPKPVPTKSSEAPPLTSVEQPVEPPQLAETGNGALWAASAASAALIAGGTMMYRRGRVNS